MYIYIYTVVIYAILYLFVCVHAHACKHFCVNEGFGVLWLLRFEAEETCLGPDLLGQDVLSAFIAAGPQTQAHLASQNIGWSMA